MDAGWIETYGYWAIFLGAILEGETALLAAGYALSQGLFDPVLVYLVGAGAGTTGDSAWYLVGRMHGAAAIRRFPRLRPLRARAVLLLRRWERGAAFVARFAWGLRVVLPLTIGAARVRPVVFFPFNAAASLVFSALWLALGWLFGAAIGDWVRGIHPFRVIAVLVAVGTLVYLVHEWRLLRSGPDEGEDVVIPDDETEVVSGPAQRR